ncbi:hypothetical protein [Streptomyces sp. SID11385]|uniref:hypothetical protein n=1 Tax=Streptomyces sp. SID11385 TaxID=2706031 RepID=UPI0013CC35F9|nr:hypothetical protein [Streptomyces sp. SID11385]NEA43383.1 hypothetical protein [Streptomyces sp. SID11385]
MSPSTKTRRQLRRQSSRPSRWQRWIESGWTGAFVAFVVLLGLPLLFLHLALASRSGV